MQARIPVSYPWIFMDGHFTEVQSLVMEENKPLFDDCHCFP